MDSILLVEDNPVDALFLWHCLQHLGFAAARSVRCGEEALEILSRAHFDAVLMDINLAGRLDGVETAARINALSDLPVIFLTGNNDPATRKRAAATRHWAILDKPVHPDQLEAALRRALPSSPCCRSAKQVPSPPGHPEAIPTGYAGRPGPSLPTPQTGKGAPPSRTGRAGPND